MNKPSLVLTTFGWTCCASSTLGVRTEAVSAWQPRTRHGSKMFQHLAAHSQVARGGIALSGGRTSEAERKQSASRFTQDAALKTVYGHGFCTGCCSCRRRSLLRKVQTTQAWNSIWDARASNLKEPRLPAMAEPSVAWLRNRKGQKDATGTQGCLLFQWRLRT